MRSRLLDVVLIVGLVAVAGGIMWTLFNLGSSPRTDAPTPSTVSPAPSTPAGSQVTPVDPAGSQVTPVDPAGSQATPVDPDGAVAPPAGPDDAATPPSDAPPPPPREVPAGSVALERIGFSYVTGGPGACGVVLEAWVHVAVSRDLLATYGCGTEVLVTLDDPAGDRSEVVGVIGDTMNPSFERTVNVYVGEDEDAFAYGLTSGVFAPR
jgi:3D (Asp-Asp-Asp) domain-containing protein